MKSLWCIKVVKGHKGFYMTLVAFCEKIMVKFHTFWIDLAIACRKNP